MVNNNLYSVLAVFAIVLLHLVGSDAKCNVTPECSVVTLSIPSQTTHNCECIETLFIFTQECDGECPSVFKVGQNASISGTVQLLVEADLTNTTIQLELGDVVQQSVVFIVKKNAALKALSLTNVKSIGGSLHFTVDGSVEDINVFGGCFRFIDIGSSFEVMGDGHVGTVSIPFLGRVGTHGIGSHSSSFEITANVDRFYVNTQSTRSQCGVDPIKCARPRLEVFGSIHLLCSSGSCDVAIADVVQMLSTKYHNITSLEGTHLDLLIMGFPSFFMTISPFHFSTAGMNSLILSRVGEFQTVDNPAFPQNMIDIDPRFNSTVTLNFVPVAKTISVSSSVLASTCSGQGVPKNDGSGECVCFFRIPDGDCATFSTFPSLSFYVVDLTDGVFSLMDTLRRVDLDETNLHYVYVGYNLILRNSQDMSRLSAWHLLYVNDDNTHATQIGQSVRSFRQDQLPLQIFAFEQSFFGDAFTFDPTHEYLLQISPGVVCINNPTPPAILGGIGKVVANASLFGTYSEAPFYQGDAFPFTTTSTTMSTTTTTPVHSTSISTSSVSFPSTSTASTSSTTTFEETGANSDDNRPIIIAVAAVVVVIALVIAIVVVVGKRRSDSAPFAQTSSSGSNNNNNINDSNKPEVIVLSSFGTSDVEDVDADVMFENKSKRAKQIPVQSHSMHSSDGATAMQEMDELEAAIVRDDPGNLQETYSKLFSALMKQQQPQKRAKEERGEEEGDEEEGEEGEVKEKFSSTTDNRDFPDNDTSETVALSSFLSSLSPVSSAIDANSEQTEAERFVDTRLHDNNTMLMKAVTVNAVECLPMLCSLSPRLDVTNNRQENLLHLLCSDSCEEETRRYVMTHVFKAHKEHWSTIDVNAYDIDGFTPLMKAVRLDLVNMVTALMEHGADPLIRSMDSCGVDFAEERGDATMSVDNVLHMKNELSQVTEGLNSIGAALVYHHANLLEIMLRHARWRRGVYRDTDKEGRCALHLAVQLNAIECILHLMQADRRMVFVSGGPMKTTPFHDAINLNYAAVVKELIAMLSPASFQRLLLVGDVEGRRPFEMVTHTHIDGIDGKGDEEVLSLLRHAFFSSTYPSNAAGRVVANEFRRVFGSSSNPVFQPTSVAAPWTNVTSPVLNTTNFVSSSKEASDADHSTSGRSSNIHPFDTELYNNNFSLV
eukprot:m.136556 g.136556  ORF g.136556 m.136556 type:complete len:1169 (-) comp13143_c0_seq2:3018-6524(-)